MWRRFHGRVKEDLILRHGAGRRLLDLGCGVGGDVWRWKRCGVQSVVGLEPDLESACEASRRIVKAGCGDRYFVVHTPDMVGRLRLLGDNTFGCISVMFVAHLMSAEERSLAWCECERVLEKGGRLVVCLPDADAITRYGVEDVVTVRDGAAWWNLDSPYFRRACAGKSEPLLSAVALGVELRSAGFQNVTVTPFSAHGGFAALPRGEARVSELYATVEALA